MTIAFPPFAVPFLIGIVCLKFGGDAIDYGCDQSSNWGEITFWLGGIVFIAGVFFFLTSFFPAYSTALGF